MLFVRKTILSPLPWKRDGSHLTAFSQPVQIYEKLRKAVVKADRARRKTSTCRVPTPFVL